MEALVKVLIIIASLWFIWKVGAVLASIVLGLLVLALVVSLLKKLF